jgi:hypothetical protein
VTELEVEANTFRRMVLELDRRFPGLGRQIDESMAVAIDGEIFQDAYLAQLKPESEIYLIRRLAATDRCAACGTTTGDPDKSTAGRLPCSSPDRRIRSPVGRVWPPVCLRRLPAHKYMIRNGLSPIGLADLRLEPIFHPVFTGFAGGRRGG